MAKVTFGNVTHARVQFEVQEIGEGTEKLKW